MIASKFFSRLLRGGAAHTLVSASSRLEALDVLFPSGFRSLAEPTSCAFAKAHCQSNHLSIYLNATIQRFGFSTSASPQSTEKEAKESKNHEHALRNGSQDGMMDGSANAHHDPSGMDQAPDVSHSPGSNEARPHPDRRRRRRSKRTAFSDSDTESELSKDDLVKLVAEKEELLKLKHKEIEKMQDKVLRSYAEMENVIDRTKREAENSKKYAIQNFAKSLLDVADNLARAASVVKESFSKLDTSKDSAGAVPLLKTLLEGVEMTEKQLFEVFKKFGMEKFDPTNEHFDPHKHHAVFRIPDATKPPGTVAVVVKTGYMLYDRVLRPAEVGVTEVLDETDQNSSN